MGNPRPGAQAAVMRCALVLIVVMFEAAPGALAAWNFVELNYSPGEAVVTNGIDWRPQGDYAVIAARVGLFRVDYPGWAISYQAYPGASLVNVTWAPDGSYALITGADDKLYRYEHSGSGFGAVNEITSIEMNGAAALTFYDSIWDPTNLDDPAYICVNRESGSGQHQIYIYRYDPGASPFQVYWDGPANGTTEASNWEYGPVSAAFQADGDYLVIASKFANGWSGGFFVYDPDQSRFPKDVSGAMQFFDDVGSVGNANAVAMPAIAGQDKRFVLLKGNGMVQRIEETTGLPPNFGAFEDPSPPCTIGMNDFGGDIACSYEGSRCLAVDSQTWSPHTLVAFDENGTCASTTGLSGADRSIRLYSVNWHPAAPVGLVAGQDRWILRFDTDEIPQVAPPPPAGDGLVGAPLMLTKGSGDTLHASFDVVTCSDDHAVMLYGHLGDFSGYGGAVTNCDLGATGSADFDISIANVWFNLVWVNSEAAGGHPGYGRTWPAAGLCGITSDDHSDTVCD